MGNRGLLLYAKDPCHRDVEYAFTHDNFDDLHKQGVLRVGDCLVFDVNLPVNWGFQVVQATAKVKFARLLH